MQYDSTRSRKMLILRQDGLKLQEHSQETMKELESLIMTNLPKSSGEFARHSIIQLKDFT